MEKIRKIIKDLHYAKLKLINEYIVLKPNKKYGIICAKIIKLKENGFFEIKQNITTNKISIKFDDIERIAKLDDLETIPGTNIFENNFLEKLKEKLQKSNSENNDYLSGNYIVFKNEKEDKEECAIIDRVESNNILISQKINGWRVNKYIKLSNILRNASINDLEDIPGTLYNQINRRRNLCTENDYDLNINNNYIVFKKKEHDNEECAKFVNIEKGIINIAQRINNYRIKKKILLSHILRSASTHDLENIQGTDYYLINNSMTTKCKENW